MSSPHDIAVRSGVDPQAMVLCPVCAEPFCMELGHSKWVRVKLADEDEWKDMELVFCGMLCAWIATRERSVDA